MLSAFRRLRPPAPPEALRPALARLGKGSLAIDCGANVGDVTIAFARTGARVLAIEPNPVAFEQLTRRLRHRRNVDCLQAAVSVRDGTARLYLHEDAGEDPIRASVGSSLLAEKRNVDPSTWIEVKTIDLDALVAARAPVAVMKMDVEGAEISILERFLETGRMSEIGYVVIEMHDWHTEELGRRGAAIREELKDPRYAHVRLDWH